MPNANSHIQTPQFNARRIFELPPAGQPPCLYYPGATLSADTTDFKDGGEHGPSTYVRRRRATRLTSERDSLKAAGRSHNALEIDSLLPVRTRKRDPQQVSLAVAAAALNGASPEVA